MKFIKVNEVPERITVRNKKPITSKINKFLAMGCKIARVEMEEGEFLHNHSCYSTLIGAIEKYNYPIQVSLVNGEVYLIRTDI